MEQADNLFILMMVSFIKAITQGSLSLELKTSNAAVGVKTFYITARMREMKGFELENIKINYIEIQLVVKGMNENYLLVYTHNYIKW